jgi:hypothetical protein
LTRPTHTTRIAVTALLLLSAIVASASTRQGSPPDGAEIVVTQLVSSVETTLTVLPRGPRGDLPVSLVFRAVHEERPRSDLPSEIGLGLVISPLFAGPFDLEPPQVVFVTDEHLTDADTLAASIDGPLFSVGSGLVDKVNVLPFDADALSRLEAATTIRGRVFDLEFTLTPQQVRSIGEFARRIRQRPR